MSDRTFRPQPGHAPLPGANSNPEPRTAVQHGHATIPPTHDHVYGLSDKELHDIATNNNCSIGSAQNRDGSGRGGAGR
jgi:hypothetical protein